MFYSVLHIEGDYLNTLTISHAGIKNVLTIFLLLFDATVMFPAAVASVKTILLLILF